MCADRGPEEQRETGGDHGRGGEEERFAVAFGAEGHEGEAEGDVEEERDEVVEFHGVVGERGVEVEEAGPEAG